MYTREVFQNVKDIIEERKRNAETGAETRTLELHMKSPKIKAIDAELAGTGFKIFKAASSGGDISGIKERNQALMKERFKALALMGLPDDYTDPKYICKICSDTGYDANGHMCSCMRELIRLESIKASGIGKLIEKQSFENFDLTLCDEADYEKMYYNFTRLKEFAYNFNENSAKTFLLIGTTGTGKTHLSTAVAKTVIERGFSVVYDSVQNIITDFENDKFKSGYGHHESKSEKYMTADLLIMDDLGTEFFSQFSLSCIYNIINTRQNKGLSTVISTNLSPKELVEKYEARITSRLNGSETELLKFEGIDHRIY